MIYLPQSIPGLYRQFWTAVIDTCRYQKYLQALSRSNTLIKLCLYQSFSLYLPLSVGHHLKDRCLLTWNHNGEGNGLIEVSDVFENCQDSFSQNDIWSYKDTLPLQAVNYITQRSENPILMVLWWQYYAPISRTAGPGEKTAPMTIVKCLVYLLMFPTFEMGFASVTQSDLWLAVDSTVGQSFWILPPVSQTIQTDPYIIFTLYD